MTRQEIEALIDAGDIEACIAAFRGMPEAERAKLGSAAVARMRAVGKGVSAQLGPLLDAGPILEESGALKQLLRHNKFDGPRLASYRAARVAVLATASFNQWKGVRAHSLPANDVAFQILTDRRPPWLADLLGALCDDEDPFNDRWSLVRRLVREGYSTPPQNPRYIDRMLLSSDFHAARFRGDLKNALLDDPGLLDYEIWRIFDTEPGPLAVSVLTGAKQDIRPESTWEAALAALAAEGRIPREKLLDATLNGLARDMHEMRARWFAVLHDRLEPTEAERASRVTRDVDLLGSRHASTIAFAMKVLKGLLKKRSCNPAIVVERLDRAFHARTKSTVKDALALLDLAVAASDDAGLSARASIVAAEGLIHDAADVQGSILDFIERRGNSKDESLRKLLMSRADSLAASVRGRLQSWLELDDQTTEPPVAIDFADLAARSERLDSRLAALAGVPDALAAVRGERPDLPALSFDGTEIPRLDPGRRLEPIDDLETLIELCSRLVEKLKPLDDVDRCVDAISRLCDRRPSDFLKRTAPLAARLRQRLAEPAGIPTSLLHWFSVIVMAWLTGEVGKPTAFDRFRSLDGFFSAWVFALARRVARPQPAPLLAAPTHAGGWIDPHALVQRFRERSQLPLAGEPADLILAILRLAPDHRATALAEAGDLNGEPGAAIRYALGAQQEKIGPTPALWIAAARARAPWSDDPAVEAQHPRRGPDAGQAATYRIDGTELIRRWVPAHPFLISASRRCPRAKGGCPICRPFLSTACGGSRVSFGPIPHRSGRSRSRVSSRSGRSNWSKPARPQLTIKVALGFSYRCSSLTSPFVPWPGCFWPSP